jgi:hypothetical protein
MITLRTASIAAWVVLSAGAAEAQDGVWGFTIFDQKGDLVSAKWPEQESFILGSSRDAYLRLDDLEPLHAYFELLDGKFLVRPMYGATVLVNGRRIEAETEFDTRDEIQIGRYRINFYLSTDDPPEELPPAAAPGIVPDDGGDAVAAIVPAASPADAAERAHLARKDEYAKPSYAFCHDPEFGKDGTWGADLCPMFDATSDEVCPEARKSCPSWTYPKASFDWFTGDGDGGGSGSGSGKGKGKSAGEGKGARPSSRVSERRILIPLPKEVGLVLLALVAGALLFWFIKSMRSAGWEGEELELGDEALSEAARNLQALPDARSNVLVKLAQRALARGEDVEAAILVHLAVLRYLDDEGIARYHPSKTNGDYLRAIRRHKPLAALLRGVAMETERVRFGDGKVDGHAIAAHIREAEVLLARRATFDGIEGAAPAATMLVLLLSPILQSCPSEGGVPAFYAHDPAGLSSLPVILNAAGLPTDVGHMKLADVAPEVGVVVLRTSAARKGAWPKNLSLDDVLDRGTSVVVIDDADAASYFMPVRGDTSLPSPTAVPLEVASAAPDSSCSWKIADLRVHFSGDKAPAVPRGRRLVWNTASSTSSAVRYDLEIYPAVTYAGEPELAGLGPAAVAYAAERVAGEGGLAGCIFVFSDRDLFTNASLTRETNARFVAGFFGSLLQQGQTIQILDRLDAWSASPSSGGAGGSGSGEDGDDAPQSPAKTLEASNMLSFVVQGLLFLVLLFIFLGAAFGPLRDRVKTEHKAFVEHVEAIGRHYARTGEPGMNHAAVSLAKLVVMRNRDRVRGGPSGGWGAYAKHLAETHGLAEADVRAALRLGIEGKSELGTPRIDDPKPGSSRMLETLSKLLNIGRTKGVGSR